MSAAADPAPHIIRCAEIWGGILAIDTEIETPGLTASIFSCAYEGEQGGDIYYASVCKWDYLTRFAIADLRGHGEQASQLSSWLYESVRKHMNTTNGNKILADLNGIVRTRGFDAITTAVVLGYHTRKERLYFSYAGHPPALVQHGIGRWRPLNLAESPRPANLPLGILPSVQYDMGQIAMAPSDRICLYTDGVTECPRADGEPFGEDRLIDSLNRHAALPPSALKAAVLADLLEYRGECPPDDDVTLLIAQVSKSGEH